MSAASYRLFVYGTLRAGGALAGRLPARCGRLPARLHDARLVEVRPGWYPAVVPGSGVVVGEVVEVDPTDVAAVDALRDTLEMEEAAGYRVVPTDVVLADGSAVEALVCWWGDDARWLGADVPDGDWIAYAARRD